MYDNRIVIFFYIMMGSIITIHYRDMNIVTIQHMIKYCYKNAKDGDVFFLQIKTLTLHLCRLWFKTDFQNSLHNVYKEKKYM